ncbi:MAG: carbohydrate-binding domain-containing protein [Oscillospiraceae bacterium]|nr:carbohydrate-binding domain-containing protein [Oscillospiraceae bacterium]
MKTTIAFFRRGAAALCALLFLAAAFCFRINASAADGAAPDTAGDSAASLVSERDASGEYDASAAVTLAPGSDLTITAAGVYILSGSYENQMITVRAGEEDKVQIVLNNAQIMNADGPAILVCSADKVFLTAAEGSENSISDGSGYTLKEGDTAVDAAVFSKADLTVNGSGSLSITGNTKHAVVSKDDLVVTAKNLTVSSAASALTGKDAVTLLDASVSIQAGTDGLHSEGTVTVLGGSLTAQCGDDAVHADGKADIAGGTVTLHAAEGIEATYVLIRSGDISIQASDDGINAAYKSDAYTPTVEITGGNLTVTMGAGDTDGIDSNGNLIISGGTVSVTGSSAFDFDGSVSFTGGTVIVNGQQVTEITGQFMGGRGGMGGMGGMGGQGGFGAPPDMSGDIPADFGGQPPSGFHGPHGGQGGPGSFGEAS